MAKKKSKKINNGMFAVSCILLALIVMAIIFLLNKDKILSNYKQTGFFDRVFGKTPEFVEKHEDTKKDTITLKDDENIVIEIEKENPSVKEILQNETSETINSIQEKVGNLVQDSVKEKLDDTQKSVKDNVSKLVENKTEQPKKQNPSTFEYQLCFVNIDSDGSVVRKIVKRNAEKSDSPLTTSINFLISGPLKSSNAEKNCMTLIPEGTKLLSARVSDGIAYLNFNENFEFNNLGVEGIRGQLMQIVYTATCFSTVKSVQFLIEGEKQEYLGSEGQWIGSPLSRSNF